MKPAPFEYVRPDTLEEACALMAADEDARVIAGGQTLVPMLAMRLARPSRLVDIQRLAELSGIRRDGAVVSVGAMTRQAEAERNPILAADVPLLASVLPWVGHPPTRSRGTVGGSIGNADPSAEIPLAAVTLGAEIVVRDADGPQTIAANEFFIGAMLTAIPIGGVVTEIRFPVWTQGRVGVGFHEVSARSSDFAFVSAAAQVALDENGACLDCAIGIGGVGDCPVPLDAAAAALKGSSLSDADIRAAVMEAVEGLDALSDLHATAAYRRRVAGVLAQRALADARTDAFGGGR